MNQTEVPVKVSESLPRLVVGDDFVPYKLNHVRAYADGSRMKVEATYQNIEDEMDKGLLGQVPQ